MLLTKREEQLLRAFLELGKLSLANMADILKVSQRTVYRTLADLGESLSQLEIDLIKDGDKYHLSGDLERLSDYRGVEGFNRHERLNWITYRLLVSPEEMTNEQLQETFMVSNVTIIQDIADIEERLNKFDLHLQRKKGYALCQNSQLRRFLAILLTNNLPVSDFWQSHQTPFPILDEGKLAAAKTVFLTYQEEIPALDARLREFFVILLALSGWQEVELKHQNVSKVALDFTQKVYADYSRQTNSFYNIQEMLYYASILDEMLIKRQETPLFQENFDSQFFYKVSNLIDKVGRYTKMNFAKDRTLFRFLFNHIRLNLAVPVIFPDPFSLSVAHLALEQNDYLHRVVSLLVQDIFPKYLQNTAEYDLISLHFAASLRRSPDIYPIRILLLTNERPLTVELLVARIKTVAPFVEEVIVKEIDQYQADDEEGYDYLLATKPLPQLTVDVISVYPSSKEILALQDKLQEVQANRRVLVRQDLPKQSPYDLQTYLQATQSLLSGFQFEQVDNPDQFEATVRLVVNRLQGLSDPQDVAEQLLARFKLSPLAIPGTNLALLHAQSRDIKQSCFAVYELGQEVSALSMNQEEERVKRVLLMLVNTEEGREVRDLMTAISQSIIENHLYTEIYKTGNRDIIYHLLNQIFTDKLKKLED